MSSGLTNYGAFAVLCLLLAIVMLRLVLRERLMLQGSISYLSFLAIIGLLAVFSKQATFVAHALGFTLLSNFLFAVSVGLLALLHLRALITLSKVHMRTVALTQELAIVQERLDSAMADRDTRSS